MPLQFNLSKMDYHKGELGEKDKEIITGIFNRLYELYPEVKDEWYKLFKEYSLVKGDDYYYEKTLLKVLWATTHYLMVINDKLYEKGFYSELKELINHTLPVVLINDKKFISDNPFLYEPPNAYLMYIANFLPVYYSKILKEQLSFKDRVYFLNLSHLFKSISACLTLFGVSDDVHGMATLRGFIGQFTRLTCLNDENIDRYMRYVKLNFYLQDWKSKRDKNKPMHEDLKKFLEENDLTVNNCESYLLYGWHVVQNKPVTNMKRFIETNFNKQDAERINYFYHLTSEFVHEDYLFTSYNYPSLRKKAQYFILDYASMTLRKLKNKLPEIYICITDVIKEVNKMEQKCLSKPRK